jgi:hypothetical protein
VPHGRAGKPGSHRGKGWEEVTTQAIRALVARDEPLVAILWGRDAQTLEPMLTDVPLVKSAHPSPMSATAGFFGSRPFSRVNRLLEELGGEPGRLVAAVARRSSSRSLSACRSRWASTSSSAARGQRAEQPGLHPLAGPAVDDDPANDRPQSGTGTQTRRCRRSIAVTAARAQSAGVRRPARPRAEAGQVGRARPGPPDPRERRHHLLRLGDQVGVDPTTRRGCRRRSRGGRAPAAGCARASPRRPCSPRTIRGPPSDENDEIEPVTSTYPRLSRRCGSAARHRAVDAGEVRVDHALELVGVADEHGAVGDDAGVGDDGVEPAEALGGGRDGGVHRACDRTSPANHAWPSPRKVAGDLRERGLVAGDERDRGRRGRRARRRSRRRCRARRR